VPRLEPIVTMSGRRGSRRGRAMRVSTSLAEINVVPLVDVMLVLLVIFMVAAPMMQQGFPVQLPKSTQSPPIKAEPVVVTVPYGFRRDGKIYLGTQAVTLDNLRERLRQELSGRIKRDVILAGDGRVTFDDLVWVMDRLKEAGVDTLSIKTQPGPPERQP